MALAAMGYLTVITDRRKARQRAEEQKEMEAQLEELIELDEVLKDTKQSWQKSSKKNQ